MGLLTADNTRDTVVAWVFVLVQGALLAAILLLPSGDDWVAPSWLATSAYALQLLGIGVLLLGLVNLGRSLTPLPTPVPHGELRSGGLYRFVRHPIYSGVMALAIGSAIRSGSLAVAAAAGALVAWFALKARWEERQLLRRYTGYGAYAARTPRFLPFWSGGRRSGPEADR